MTFKDLGIIGPILKALEGEGYEAPTLIQKKAIPVLLKGKDLLGCAQTGTGKTAAFAIPIIQQLSRQNHHQNGQRRIMALVVAPTRELAIQVNDSFSTYGKYTSVRNTVIFGGVNQHAQVKALKKGVDILVATPGRLLDLINQGFVSLDHVRFSVLDEADHMLDMGFLPDIKRIIAKLPNKRQSLFFSATMPSAIVDLSNKILGNPFKITVKPDQPTAEKVDQAVYFVEKQDKIKLLKHLLKINEADSAIVFSRTKHGANKIVKLLGRAGVQAAAIHGNKSQNNRQQTLRDFKKGKIHVLVATDIAARGIDVDNLSMVINYDLPNVPETYVHRIGRTGRAEASGVALSFCAPEERSFLKSIQKLIDSRIPVITDHPFVSEDAIGTVETPKPHHAYPVDEKRGNKKKHRHRSRRRSRHHSRNKQTAKG